MTRIRSREANWRSMFVKYHDSDYIYHRENRMSDKEEVLRRLKELGVFVQDYEIYTAKQLDDILWAIKALPRQGRKSNLIGFAA